MKISEIFPGLQGEGRFQGTSVLFIRLSGCTRKCSWCDTSYHNEGKEYTEEQLTNIILEYYKKGIVAIVWTGGEPLLQLERIEDLTCWIPREIEQHLETNGDLIKNSYQADKLSFIFDYIAISPKDIDNAIHIYSIYRWHNKKKYDIKIVTDLKTLNIDMLEYATSLMPLTTYNKRKDEQIRKKVWNYCVEHNLHYSARLHVINFGKKRKI